MDAKCVSHIPVWIFQHEVWVRTSVARKCVKLLVDIVKIGNVTRKTRRNEQDLIDLAFHKLDCESKVVCIDRLHNEFCYQFDILGRWSQWNKTMVVFVPGGWRDAASPLGCCGSPPRSGPELVCAQRRRRRRPRRPAELQSERQKKISAVKRPVHTGLRKKKQTKKPKTNKQTNKKNELSFNGTVITQKMHTSTVQFKKYVSYHRHNYSHIRRALLLILKFWFKRCAINVSDYGKFVCSVREAGQLVSSVDTSSSGVSAPWFPVSHLSLRKFKTSECANWISNSAFGFCWRSQEQQCEVSKGNNLERVCVVSSMDPLLTPTHTRRVWLFLVFSMCTWTQKSLARVSVRKLTKFVMSAWKILAVLVRLDQSVICREFPKRNVSLANSLLLQETAILVPQGEQVTSFTRITALPSFKEQVLMSVCQGQNCHHPFRSRGWMWSGLKLPCRHRRRGIPLPSLPPPPTTPEHGSAASTLRSPLLLRVIQICPVVWSLPVWYSCVLKGRIAFRLRESPTRRTHRNARPPQFLWFTFHRHTAKLTPIHV